MIRRKPLLLLLCLSLIAMLSIVGCAPKDPIERIAQSRQEYTVKLNQFLVQDPPAPEPAPEPMVDEADGEATDGDAGEEPATDETDAGDYSDFEPEPVGPQPKNVLFDLIVGYDGSDPLPGLTVEVSQIDPFQKEKATYRHYLELPNLRTGTTQTDFVLENIMFEDGDGFSVDLRMVVPEAERGEYREFAGGS